MPRSYAHDQATRDHVLELHGQGVTRNDIARQTGVAAGTVTKWVQDAGRTFDRADTAAATAARSADNRAKRAELESGLLDDALRLRKQLFAPCTVHNFGGKNNTFEQAELDMPPFDGQKAIMLSIGAAVDRAVKLSQLDADQASSGARSLLNALAASLGIPDDNA